MYIEILKIILSISCAHNENTGTHISETDCSKLSAYIMTLYRLDYKNYKISKMTFDIPELNKSYRLLI